MKADSIFVDWTEGRRLVALTALIARRSCERKAQYAWSCGQLGECEAYRQLAHAVARVLFDIQSNRIVPLE